MQDVSLFVHFWVKEERKWRKEEEGRTWEILDVWRRKAVWPEAVDVT